jgi:hypothetical protein
MPNWDSINKVMQEVADRESKVVSVRAESLYPTDGSQLSALNYTAAVRIAQLEAALTEALTSCSHDLPEYHEQGMGCGLEDRNITDRYEAMAFGWEQAMERVESEIISNTQEILATALNPKTGETP